MKKTNKDLSENNIQNNCEFSDRDQDMHKTVGGVVHTTYLVFIYFGRKNDKVHFCEQS